MSNIQKNANVTNNDIGYGRKVFAGNTVSLTLMQAAKILFPLITLPYLARVLEPDCYSIRAYVIGYMVFIQTLIDFGFAQYGTKLVALLPNQSKKLSSINSDVMLGKLALSALSVIIVALSCIFIPILRDNPVFLLLSFLSIAFKSFLPDFMLQGLEDMKAIAIRVVSTQGVAVLLIFAFVHSPYQLNLVPAFEGAGAIVSLIWTVIYLKRRHDVGFGKPSISNTLSILKGSWPFFVSLAASALMSSTVTVLMGVFVTSALVIDCWTISVTLIQGIQSLWQPITRSLFPHMVKRKDLRLLKKLLVFGIPAVIAIVLLCHFAAEWIMVVMGGKEYVQGSYILAYSVFIMPFSFAIALIGYPLIGAIGKPSRLSACTGIAGIAQLAVLLILGISGGFNVIAAIMVRIGSEFLLLLLETYAAVKTIKELPAAT